MELDFDFSSLPRVTLPVSLVLQAGVRPDGWRGPSDLVSAWINCGNCWVRLKGGERPAEQYPRLIEL